MTKRKSARGAFSSTEQIKLIDELFADLDEKDTRIQDVESNNYSLIQHKEDSGTHGGEFTSGSWQTRPLTDIVLDPAGNVTLSSNQLQLKPGTYRIYASAPAREVLRHKTRLRDVTNGKTILGGTSERSSAAAYSFTRSFVMGQFTVNNKSDRIELQHRCSTTRSFFGMGLACDFDEDEIYAVIELWKIS